MGKVRKAVRSKVKIRKISPERQQRFQDARWAQLDPDVQRRHRGEFVVPFQGRIVAHGIDAAAAPCEVAGTYTREQGRAAAERLLQRHREVTAIVAATDLLALGVYDALRETGRECPKDVSVVGHNDMPLVDLVQPGLTTVRISHFEMGRQTADLLEQAIQDPGGAVRNVVLQPVLIVRSSTARPRHATSRKNEARMSGVVPRVRQQKTARQ